MKIIKSARRSHMNQDTLDALMRVHSDGPSIVSFNPQSAIHHWLSSGPGTRHLRGHKVPQKTQGNYHKIILSLTTDQTASDSYESYLFFMNHVMFDVLEYL